MQKILFLFYHLIILILSAKQVFWHLLSGGHSNFKKCFRILRCILNTDSHGELSSEIGIIFQNILKVVIMTFRRNVFAT